MDIYGAARYFNRDPITDGYTGDFLFNAMVATVNDTRSDGSTDRRRILQTAPGVTPPDRGVIAFGGSLWVLGGITQDRFMGKGTRQHITMKRVTDNMSLLTPAQALAAAAGTAVYVQKLYLRDGSNALTDSEYDSFWNIFLAASEPAAVGSFFRDVAGRLYRVRNDYVALDGSRTCESDTLDRDAFQSATFQTGVQNPVTEAVSVGSITTNVIQFEPSKFYRFRHVSDAPVQRGDKVIFLPTSVPAKPGMQLAMLGLNWQIVTVQSEIDVLAAQVRLA